MFSLNAYFPWSIILQGSDFTVITYRYDNRALSVHRRLNLITKAIFYTYHVHIVGLGVSDLCDFLRSWTPGELKVEHGLSVRTSQSCFPVEHYLPVHILFSISHQTLFMSQTNGAVTMFIVNTFAPRNIVCPWGHPPTSMFVIKSLSPEACFPLL